MTTMSCIIDSDRNLIDPSMRPFNSDFRPFAGKIVAYRKAPNCTHDKIPFHLEDSRLWFARIEKYNHETSEEPWYEMRPIWTQQQPTDFSECELATFAIGLTILIRHATREELDSISQAIDEDRAYVAYNNKILSQEIIRNAIIEWVEMPVDISQDEYSQEHLDKEGNQNPTNDDESCILC